MHRTQNIDTISRTEGGEMDMPDDEDYHCEPSKKGNFDTRHPRDSCASTSPAHGRSRSAMLHGHRGSVSILESQVLRKQAKRKRSRSAQVIKCLQAPAHQEPVQGLRGIEHLQAPAATKSSGARNAVQMQGFEFSPFYGVA